MAEAQRLAARRAVEGLGLAVDAAVVDGTWDFVGDAVPHIHRMVKADAYCLSVAAASILAKVTRDRIMRRRADSLPALVVRHQQGLPLPDAQGGAPGLRPERHPPADVGVHGPLRAVAGHAGLPARAADAVLTVSLVGPSVLLARLRLVAGASLAVSDGLARRPFGSPRSTAARRWRFPRRRPRRCSACPEAPRGLHDQGAGRASIGPTMRPNHARGYVVQQLSGLDASFLYLETPSTPMHVGGLQIYDPSTAPGGKVSFEDILQWVEHHLHLVRTLRQKLVGVPFNLDHPYWVEARDFDLEFHVRELGLPKPGSWAQLTTQTAAAR